MKLFFAALLIAVPLALTAPPEDKPAAQQKTQPAPKLREQSRVWIVRGLLAEFVTVRKAMPRAKEFPLQSDGTVNEQDIQKRIAESGTGLRPGDVVQITKIDFRKDAIVLELNGGGKQKRRWYDGVQIGTGGGPTVTRTDPNQPPPPQGGSILALDFKGPVPDVTVDDVKKMLAPVLDFSRRSVLVPYVESLPKEVQAAIKNKQVQLGMDHDMVLAAIGRPDRKERQRKGHVETEDWIYGEPPRRITIITFEEGKVVKVGQYTPGVAETPAGRAQPIPPDPSKP
jgi:hypothetical protein